MRLRADLDWRVWGIGATVEKTYKGWEFAVIVGPLVLFVEPTPRST